MYLNIFIIFKVSNVFFFVVPPIMIILFSSYSKRTANGIAVLWVLLIIIGIGSVYFHATLSLVCLIKECNYL
jgi:alkaline ceramidase